jgi:GNAT superfamily N-acetyltransferase
LRLRHEAEDWLEQRRIVQWGRGLLRPTDLRGQLLAGEWYVCRSRAGLQGALRLLWSDAPVWQHEDAPAAYVHGLVIDRRCLGVGLGAGLLRWAEAQALRSALSVLRLDCVESNSRLRRYYTDLGFREVGRRDFDGPWPSAVLFEKSISAETDPQSPS